MARAKFQSSRAKAMGKKVVGAKTAAKSTIATSPVTVVAGRTYGGAQLARETGFTAQHVGQLLKKGYSVDEIKRRAAEAKKQPAKHREPPGLGPKPRRVKGEDFASATLRKEIAIADQREMEVAVRRGELVPIAEVLNWMSTAIVQSKDILVKLEELGDRLAQELDPAVIRMTLRQEVELVLGKLQATWKGIAERAPEPEVVEVEAAADEDDSDEE